MRPLSQVLAALGTPRLLVVGDVILDRYLTGVVERISPEAPIQVLRVEGEEERLGGAGSVALDVATLGATTTLVGVTGEDDAAARVAELARARGVRLEVVVDPGRRTPVKTRHLARSHVHAQQVLRVDQESTAPSAPAVEAALRERLDGLLPTADAVLVSDYGKGALGDRLLRHLIEEGRRRGVPVVVDPKGERFDRYRGATALTPNRPEAVRACGIDLPPGDLAAAERAATRLVQDLDLDLALVTLDREGMYLKVGAAAGVHLPTRPREVFDVTGAGDMVLAVLGMGLASGLAPLEAAALANVAAGLEVERHGAVPIPREEIAARLVSGADPDATKEVAPVSLDALVVRLRAAGRRIVFTNGCFDVLHAGHVRFLHGARAQGDVLVVGLNDDAGVRRLKGAGRPVNPFEDRCAVLSALTAVDWVVRFAEDTPLGLVERIRPDVLVKGEDWREKGVAGREVVEAAGGRVVLLPLLQGRSTTDLLGRIREGR